MKTHTSRISQGGLIALSFIFLLSISFTSALGVNISIPSLGNATYNNNTFINQTTYAQWGNITGTITNQLDLISYLTSNFFTKLDILGSNYFNQTGIGLESSGNQVSANISFFDDRYANANLAYYFYNDSSSDVAGYKVMNFTQPNVLSSAVKSFTISGITNNQNITSFINSNTNLTGIKSGTLLVHIHALKSSGTESLSVYANIYSRDLSGTETLISTTETSEELTSSSSHFDLHAPIMDTNFSIDDKLVIKIVAVVSGAGTSPTAQFMVEGDTNSLFEFPVIANQININEVDPIFNNWLLTFNNNPFDQSLNKSDNVTFGYTNITGISYLQSLIQNKQGLIYYNVPAYTNLTKNVNKNDATINVYNTQNFTIPGIIQLYYTQVYCSSKNETAFMGCQWIFSDTGYATYDLTSTATGRVYQDNGLTIKTNCGATTGGCGSGSVLSLVGTGTTNYLKFTASSMGIWSFSNNNIYPGDGGGIRGSSNIYYSTSGTGTSALTNGGGAGKINLLGADNTVAVVPSQSIQVNKNMFMYGDNVKLYFGLNDSTSTTATNYPAYITYDGTNLVFNTNQTSDSANSIAYFSSNVSATGFITRTSVYDKSKGSALSKIKDASQYLTTDSKTGKETINHSAFYGYTKIQVIDKSRPVEKEVIYPLANCSYPVGIDPSIAEDKNHPEIKKLFCKDIVTTEITYPYTKEEEGVDLGMEIDDLRQANYELKNCLKVCFTNNKFIKDCLYLPECAGVFE